MIHRLEIHDFVKQLQGKLTIDVRSPIEYNHAHIPNAINIPLFTDEQRKIVGTTYKQEGKQPAIKIGLDYFGPNMRNIVTQVEQCLAQYDDKKVYVYCARGGMRSGAISWLLNMYGFEIVQCIKGYKAFRNWVLAQMELPYNLHIISGYTGSGKTVLLKQKEKYVDIEGLANHKGSAFGGINMPAQASQEMFENLMATALYKVNAHNEPIWLEDESQRLGRNIIPNSFWLQMRMAPTYLVAPSFEERLKNIVNEYGALPKEQLSTSIQNITKRLGGLETKNALQLLEENDIENCFSILLKYYDKQYANAMAKRQKNID